MICYMLSMDKHYKKHEEELMVGVGLALITVGVSMIAMYIM